MKKICIVYGNCQITPIREYLMSSSSFNSIYTMIEVPPVHLCNRETGLEKQYMDNLSKCDLFIYQPVGETFSYYLSTNYILSKLPDSCICISFPISYFTGYHPQDVRGKIIPYADKNIIKLLNEGKSKDEIISILSDDNFYSFQQVKTNLDETLQELKRRDVILDITLDDFIAKNYRKINLFYTVNHPSYYITRYLAIKILNKLGLPEQEISHITLHDLYFIGFMQPIYPSVIKHLNLSFVEPEDKYFNLGHVPMIFSEYIGRYVDIHIDNGEL
ncbi:WcbI family polysaccharide biosynthesis putative acetyltransferase [Priestia megaterium]|uniref:WcbI family polysaccharide biosynthesis putative acetyltransferase n=1 Tax=Priestia megaterium TaxID=1404 RepID=UPI0023DC083C|nr:WcbI family polysaccharide biosynthesis putative acetyltransferase [Priestia megaterium]MDF2054912.1 WcbI family polysaccharide biosynthesis putative acetyltransferase [Priestia megaterium]MDF2063036.1 WcbI family polysaccharide biosynthesis putative acetyltransferase [Priestia megaterium]